MFSRVPGAGQCALVICHDSAECVFFADFKPFDNLGHTAVSPAVIIETEDMEQVVVTFEHFLEISFVFTDIDAHTPGIPNHRPLGNTDCRNVVLCVEDAVAVPFISAHDFIELLFKESVFNQVRRHLNAGCHCAHSH